MVNNEYRSNWPLKKKRQFAPIPMKRPPIMLIAKYYKSSNRITLLQLRTTRPWSHKIQLRSYFNYGAPLAWPQHPIMPAGLNLHQ